MARGKRGQQGDPTDWVTRAADDAVRHADEGKPVTVASGASPSGPIHLGNLREFITPHFVAEELRRRGVEVRHLHSWDDYDRFRKVPAGVPAEWADHIGRPLTAVPDPWECHPNWAEHFKAPLQAALAELGIEMEEISQTEKYLAGDYREEILRAVAHRDEIERVLASHRTKKVTADEDTSDQEAQDLADSVANEDEAAGDDAVARFPFRPYCRECGRDTVTTTAYDDATTVLSYTCECGYDGSTDLSTDNEGKLVWKVDWPMRWAYERVNFEPAGRDHMTPGSSYTVGTELVSSIFDWRAPARVIYAFVGFAGTQKMSSSAGGAPTPADALRILEAPMVRWLYVRRRPDQAFDIDFDAPVVRLYDEWDALGRKAADPSKRDVAVLAWERASATAAAGRLPVPEVVVPFRTLASAADVTAGSPEHVTRVLHSSGHAFDSTEQLEPRFTRAMSWTADRPEDEHTVVRTTPDDVTLAALSGQEAEWVSLLLQGLAGLGEDPSLEAVTSLVYGVPKLAAGQSAEDKPTDEVKADQREFFGLMYRLLVDAERGPRLPTLILALGPERVRHLLGG